MGFKYAVILAEGPLAVGDADTDPCFVDYKDHPRRDETDPERPYILAGRRICEEDFVPHSQLVFLLWQLRVLPEGDRLGFCCKALFSLYTLLS